MVLGLFGFHLLLNWKWLAGVTVRLWQRALPAKTRYLYLSDLLFSAFFVMASPSGVLTARVLFSGYRNNLLKELHIFSSGVSLILFGVHLGFRWSLFWSFLKGTVRIPRRIAKPLQMGLMVLLLAVGFYYLVLSPVPRWLSNPFGGETRPQRYVLSPNNSHSLYGERPHEGERGRGQKRLKQTGQWKVQDDVLRVVMVTLVTYGSIIGFFAVPAHYLEKSWQKKPPEDSRPPIKNHRRDRL
ncbi:MAG: hypothetical protein ABDK92_10345 [Atribacterota bacterium]